MAFPTLSGVSTPVKALAALVLALLIGFGVQTCKLKRAQAAEAEAALAASNEKALRDSTRELNAIIDAKGDSVRLFQRLAVQGPQRSDAVDQALGLSRIALSEMIATVRALRITATSTGATRESETGERAGTFDVRQTPFTVHADVTLPKPPGKGSIDLGVTLDPIPLGLRLGCGNPDARGIRPASVTTTAPPWATIQLGRVEQDEGLCRSPALERDAIAAQSWWRRLLNRCGVSAGYGVVRAGDGIVTAGPAALAGCKVYP